MLSSGPSVWMGMTSSRGLCGRRSLSKALHFSSSLSQPQTRSLVLSLIFLCSTPDSSDLPSQTPAASESQTEKGKGQTLDVAIPVVHLGHKVF